MEIVSENPKSIVMFSFYPLSSPWLTYKLMVNNHQQTSALVLSPKPVEPAIGGFEGQTTKLAASSVLDTCPLPLDTCHHRPRSVGPPSLPKPRSTHTFTVLTWSTRSLPCTLALVDVLDVSHCGWSPGLLVCQSKPHIHPLALQVHRHNTSLLDLHLAVDHRVRAPHLHTTSQETCCIPNLQSQQRLVINSILVMDHVDNHSSQNESQGHISTLCSQ